MQPKAIWAADLGAQPYGSAGAFTGRDMALPAAMYDFR